MCNMTHKHKCQFYPIVGKLMLPWDHMQAKQLVLYLTNSPICEVHRSFQEQAITHWKSMSIFIYNKLYYITYLVNKRRKPIIRHHPKAFVTCCLCTPRVFNSPTYRFTILIKVNTCKYHCMSHHAFLV